MTQAGKTFKEQSPQKAKHEAWKANREGKRPLAKERGGQKNILKQAFLEEEEETQDA
jgi:tRNA 2-selenouridine synthase SelU